MDNKYPEHCDCRDPFRPDQKLYQCGSETCKFLKLFYETYLRDNSRKKDG